MDGNRGFGRAHCFLATGGRQVQAADSGDLEELTVVPVPLADVPALLTGGQHGSQMAETSPIACTALALAKLRELGVV